jgi:hypothetical protein
MLGAQAQQDLVSRKGPAGHRLWTANTGIRFRDNSYVLGSLDEGGEYQPRYIDVQSFVTIDPDGYGPWEIELLGIYDKMITVSFLSRDNPMLATSTKLCASKSTSTGKKKPLTAPALVQWH